MKKVTILNPFRDVHSFHKEYLPGQVVEFEDSRVATLIALGLVTELTEQPVKKEMPIVKEEPAEIAAEPILPLETEPTEEVIKPIEDVVPKQKKSRGKKASN